LLIVVSNDVGENSAGRMTMDRRNMKSGEKVVRKSNRIANKPTHFRD